MPSSSPGSPNSSPPANTANMTVIGETPTDCAITRGTSTLSATRETTKMIAETYSTIPPPCGIASSAATTCATSMPTNGTAYPSAQTTATSSANEKCEGNSSTHTAAPTIAHSSACPATKCPNTSTSSCSSALTPG